MTDNRKSICQYCDKPIRLGNDNYWKSQRRSHYGPGKPQFRETYCVERATQVNKIYNEYYAKRQELHKSWEKAKEDYDAECRTLNVYPFNIPQLDESSLPRPNDDRGHGHAPISPLEELLREPEPKVQEFRF